MGLLHHYWNYDINKTQLSESLVCTFERYGLRALPWTSCLNFIRLASIELEFYRGDDKSLARPGKKQANISVRMACISFGALPCRGKKNLITARVSTFLKSRASLICFRAFFLTGRAKDLSALRYIMTELPADIRTCRVYTYFIYSIYTFLYTIHSFLYIMFMQGDSLARCPKLLSIKIMSIN